MKPTAVDWSLLAVQSFDACPPGRACEHCKADRPAAPAEAGYPGERDAVSSEIEQGLRYAMPPAYHVPRFMDLTTPKVWICAVCWDDDGNLSQWPCAVASAHGKYLDRAMHLSEQVRTA